MEGLTYRDAEDHDAPRLKKLANGRAVDMNMILERLICLEEKEEQASSAVIIYTGNGDHPARKEV